MSTGSKNPDYVARGLKATIHNENTSTEAKESAAERLEQMGSDVPQDFSASKKDTSNRQVRSSATGAGQQRDDDDWETGPDERVTENEDLAQGETNRVLGGYKATLKNPNVSEGAKKHAEEVLRESYS